MKYSFLVCVEGISLNFWKIVEIVLKQFSLSSQNFSKILINMDPRITIFTEIVCFDNKKLANKCYELGNPPPQT